MSGERGGHDPHHWTWQEIVTFLLVLAFVIGGAVALGRVLRS